MKIYTRTGDNGSTGLYGGPRVAKNDVRIEAYGTVDELNAVLGVVRSQVPPEEIDQSLERIQSELFSIGAELATPDPVAMGVRIIDAGHVGTLENLIDRFESELPPLKTFVLPGGSQVAASLHQARGVCRRAERRVITLADDPAADISADLLIYLNRLSDYLFVLARWANQQAGVADVPWLKPAG